MKHHIPAKTTWVGFLNYLKQELGRNLTKEEIAEAMKVYITGKTVEHYAEDIRK